MKKLLVLLATAIVVMAYTPAMGQSRKEKKAAEKEAWQREQARKKQLEEMEFQLKLDSMNRIKAKHDNEATLLNIPCVDASYDDGDYFRDYGIGAVENGNEQLARERAFQAAKSMIKQRLGEYIQGMTDYFLESYSNDKSDKDAAGNRALTKMNGVIEGMLRDANKTCEKAGIDQKGNKKWYICIEIPKKELNSKLMNVMSEDEKLKRDFDAAQMQKFMDERMQQMLDAKKNAGY